MPNTFLTADIIAREALATLYENAVMAGLVWRDFDDDFSGTVNGYRKGQTISVRKPVVFDAEEFDRSNGINVQDAEEDTVDVTLDKIADVSFSVTSEDLTMEIGSFSERLLNPAMEAIWQKIDRDLLGLRSDVSTVVGDGSSNHAYTEPEVLIDARKELQQNSVALSDRHCVVGPVIEAGWLSSSLFHQADQRGDTEGLREASLGRKFGFDNYQDQNVDDVDGTYSDEAAVAFHRSAFSLAMRPLAVPSGAADAANQSFRGMTLRVVQDYDINAKEQIVSVDCLYGITTMDANRAVLITEGTAA